MHTLEKNLTERPMECAKIETEPADEAGRYDGSRKQPKPGVSG